MKIYVATRFENIDAARKIGADLVTLGHEVVSTWLWKDGKTPNECATQDEGDIVLKAEAILVLTTDPNNFPKPTTGGHLTELGIVLGWNAACCLFGEAGKAKRIFVLGPADTPVFMHLKEVTRIENINEIPLEG